MNRLRFGTQLFGLLALCLGAMQAGGVTKVWQGGTWNDPASWSPAGVPTASDDVVIDDNLGINSVAVIVPTIYVNSQYTRDLTVDLGDALHIGDGRRLFIHGTNVNNDGQISLQSTGGFTGIILQSDNTTFNGNGILELGNDSANYVTGRSNYSYPTPAILTNTANHTIRGSGRIGTNENVNAIGLDNQGLIIANNAGNPLTINLHPNATQRSNSGNMLATNGGQMIFYTSHLENQARQQNLWVNSGSGKAPSA